MIKALEYQMEFELEAGLMRSQADSEKLIRAVAGGCWRGIKRKAVITSSDFSLRDPTSAST